MVWQEGELSTLPKGQKIRVHFDGTVEVLNQRFLCTPIRPQVFTHPERFFSRRGEEERQTEPQEGEKGLIHIFFTQNFTVVLLFV